MERALTQSSTQEMNMKIGKAVTITVKFYAVVDNKTDTSEAVGYVLDKRPASGRDHRVRS